ncbi:MAG: hypothetical protein FWG71_07660 [Synergistaceae bacterium]|nr:hypothetical protein [Synergistaceae bacterium]
MLTQTYEGYIENGQFYPIGEVNIQGRRRVTLTVFNEPIPEQKETSQAEAWREFFEAVNASDEEVPETFERVSFTREIPL